MLSRQEVDCATTSRPKENCFDFLRTAAALIVLLSHSFPLSGLPEPLVGHETTLGSIAVWVFFSISGYLITQSALTSESTKAFALKRILRIGPALVVLLLLSVFAAGPLLTELAISDYFTSLRTYTYLVKNPAFANQESLPGVFISTPLPNGFNGSLWTIKYELLMYAMVGGLLAFTKRDAVAPTAVGLAVIFFSFTLLHQMDFVNLNKVFWRLEDNTSLRMDRLCLLGCLFFTGAAHNFWFPKGTSALYIALESVNK